MSKQMLELADELENIRKRGHFPNDSLIEDVVAALRSSAVSAEPVACSYCLAHSGGLYSYMHLGKPHRDAVDVRWFYDGPPASGRETEIAFTNLCEALGLQASAHAYLDAGAARRAVAAPSASVREALELALGAFHEQGIADRVPVTLGRIERALAALSEPAPAPDRDTDLPTANDVRGILGPAKMTILTNPEDTWDAYCAEVAEQDQSPQGAMAFAIERLSEALNEPAPAQERNK